MSRSRTRATPAPTEPSNEEAVDAADLSRAPADEPGAEDEPTVGDEDDGEDEPQQRVDTKILAQPRRRASEGHTWAVALVTLRLPDGDVKPMTELELADADFEAFFATGAVKPLR